MNVQLAGLPMLPWAAPPLSHDILAKDIMSTPVVTLRPVEQVSEIIQILETTRHQGFPVAIKDGPGGDSNHYGILHGLILRSQLKILLKEKAFCSSSTGNPAGQSPISLETFRLYYPRYPALEVFFNNLKLIFECFK